MSDHASDQTQTPRFVLVGHCGMDSGMITHAVQKAVPHASIVYMEAMAELQACGPMDVLLINRVLPGSLGQGSGVELIRELSTLTGEARPKMLLISNYPDAQQKAESAGALPGFGKNELVSPRVRELLAGL